MMAVAGAFFSTFGTLTLAQDEDAVSGRYPHEDGHVEGTLDGSTLRGTWEQRDTGKRGAVELMFDDQGNAFQGFWTFEGASEPRSRWDGTRLDLAPREAGGSPGSWNSSAGGPLLSGPLVGEVGEHDARIWVQAREPSELTLTVHGPGGVVARETVTPRWDEWLCATIAVSSLSPGTDYDYELQGPAGITPAFHFRTAPPETARTAKIPFGSCFWDWPNPALSIFDAISEEEGDLLVLLGDSCYFDACDIPTEHTMMLAQLRNRNNAAFRKLVATTPTVAVWDDHDFGPNDTDARFEGKHRAFSTFKRVWANRTYGTADAPGVFSRLRSGPVDIFLLDSRSYRGLEGNNLLGAAQLDWLLRELRASTAPVKLVASPSQVLPSYPVAKGWDCFHRDGPAELEALLSAIERHDVRGVVFVSGDLHMANLMHLPGRPLGGGGRGPDFWELTASPLANDPWREAAGGDPTLLREVIDMTNYGVVDVDLDRAGAEVQFLLKDASGATIFEQPIPLEDLRAR